MQVMLNLTDYQVNEHNFLTQISWSSQHIIYFGYYFIDEN